MQSSSRYPSPMTLPLANITEVSGAHVVTAVKVISITETISEHMAQTDESSH